MASPKTHLVGTVCVIVAHWIRNLTTNFSLEWHYLWVVGVSFCLGVLVDMDHFLQWRRVKVAWNIRKERQIPFVRAWVKSFEVFDDRKANFFHTWPAAVVFLLIAWFLTRSFLPIVVYCFHILIDSFDAGYASKKNFWEIPGVISQLVPVRARYRD